jgi:hypothetical protein
MTSFILHDRSIFRGFPERVEELVDESENEARASRTVEGAIGKIRSFALSSEEIKADRIPRDSKFAKLFHVDSGLINLVSVC